MKFADISYELSILDKYLELTDQELSINRHTHTLDIWSTQYNDYRFDYEIEFADLVECLIELAHTEFTDYYECYEDEDYMRQSVYINHLQLARLWLEIFKEGK